MARHVPRQLVAATLLVAAAATLAAGVATAASSRELVRYGFDEELATGPDTLRVFQNARGRVSLSTAFRLDGYRSVEIRDVAGDGDFPELRGSFPLRSEGRLHAHFGFLVTDPAQSFNVALAGPEGFSLKKNGIAFWLQGRAGMLYHVSDSTPMRLAPLAAFVWYIVDLDYDVTAGTYDLTIREENAHEPAVARRAQANATARPGSGVEVFSFIGDVGSDDSDADYFVDQIVLAADRTVAPAAFVAPGRRKLFVDAWSEYRMRLAAGPVCFPVDDVAADLGLDARDLAATGRDDASKVVAAALDRRGPRKLGRMRGTLPAPLAAVAAWADGCDALRSSKIEEAVSSFERAEALWPKGRIYPLSRALALARTDRAADAERILDSIDGLFRGDVRLTIAKAQVGIARGDLEAARSWLAASAEGTPLDTAGDEGLAAQYVLVLLWNGDYADALRFASAMEARLAEAGMSGALWSERIGDAAFLLDDAPGALEAYRRALDQAGASPILCEKLADASFRLGDLEQERLWREKVYGSLR